MIYVYDMTENIVRKWENVGYQIFFPFHKMFFKVLCTVVVKNRDLVWKIYWTAKEMSHKKYNSQFSLNWYDEIVYMCNGKILVQR